MKTEQEIKNISKFLSLVLRHDPKKIQLNLDENGWAEVDELLSKINKHRMKLDLATLQEVVATNDKKRFAFNEEQTKIRASQGHSIKIDLDIEAVEPPVVLYHGTVGKFIESIKKEGLQKMNRQHVHLSQEKATAINVGSRRGVPTILVVNSGEMHKDGFTFYLSENKVWLTDEVPAKYIVF